LFWLFYCFSGKGVMNFRLAITKIGVWKLELLLFSRFFFVFLCFSLSTLLNYVFLTFIKYYFFRRIHDLFGLHILLNSFNHSYCVDRFFGYLSFIFYRLDLSRATSILNLYWFMKVSSSSFYILTLVLSNLIYQLKVMPLKLS